MTIDGNALLVVVGVLANLGALVSVSARLGERLGRIEATITALSKRLDRIEG